VRPLSAGPGSAVRAVVLAVLGFTMCAVFAATPGSPFQPVLPRGAEASGPFTWLAGLVGFDSLSGSWLIGAGVVCSLVAVAGFLLVLREAYRGTISLRAVVVLALIFNVAILTLPLLFSRDVYSYAFYGRIAGVYDANPYVHTPVEYAGDNLWPFVGPKWVDTPAVYGPLFTSVSSVVARLASSPAEQVASYRLIAVFASLLTLGLVVLTTARVRPGRVTFAAAAFGLNPVVLFLTVGSGHNDLLVALSIIGAVALLTSDRELPAIAVLSLGALVKATAALPLLLVIVWCVARQPRERRVRTLLTHAGLALAIGLAFSAPYLQLDDPTLGMIELAGHTGWLAPSVLVGKVVDFFSFGTMSWLARIAFAVALVVCVVELARTVAARARAGDAIEELGAAIGWSLVLLMLLGPALLPWYVAWALPVVWLLPKAPRTTLLAAGVALAMSQWSTEPLRYPDAFAVNLWLGHWIVTPVMLGLVTWCLIDLRRRIRARLPLEETEPIPAEAGQH
jgi:alpha-1,6-mannosyltransferase